MVVQAGGFNKAAGDNEYKQSQYSRQIADLEKFFGCRLFYREGRTSRLTPEGAKLLEISKLFFSELELFKTAVSGQKIDLVISAGHSVINFFLTADINKKLQQLSKTVSFKATTTEESVQDVLSYESHFAIVGKKTPNKNLKTIKLLSSPAIMVYSKEHRDKFYTGENLSKLAGNPTAMLAGSGEYKKGILKVFKGNTLNIISEAPYFSAIKTYALQGQAVAYIPEYCLTEEDRSYLETYPFKDLSMVTRDLFLVYRKNVVSQSDLLEKIAEVFLKN